jgi:hypothetical protein
MRGFPPKTIARLLRFNRAVRSLDRVSPTRAKEPASAMPIGLEATCRSRDGSACSKEPASGSLTCSGETLIR